METMIVIFFFSWKKNGLYGRGEFELGIGDNYRFITSRGGRFDRRFSELLLDVMDLY